MPNGFLNISHNFAGETNFIVVEWVKSIAQGTPVVGHVTGTGLGAQNDTDVTQVFYPAPHVNQQLQVINISEAWHLVRFWRSSDGVAKDLLLLELAGNARTGALFPIQRYEYVVGRGYDNTTPVITEGVWSDPIENDKGIRDTRLFEKAFWVEERGLGSLLEAEIIVRDDEGGGFDFADSTKEMFEGGIYIIYVINKVTQGGDDSGIVENDDNVYILDGNETYNPVTMGGRTLLADFADQVGILTFNDLGSVADSKFILQTHGGNQRNVVLQLAMGNTVKFRKQDVNKIVLGEGEQIEILIKNGVMYVIDSDTNHENLGVAKHTYKELLNGLKADGSLLLLANYPRVAELIDSLPAGVVVDETTWQTSVTQDGLTTYPNKGKWMSNGTNFRPPDLRDQTMKSLSILDGSVPSGRYEHQAVLDHYHNLVGTGDTGIGKYISSNHGYGGNSSYNLYHTDGPPDDNYRASGVRGVAITPSSYNKVNNIGLYPIICI